MPLFTKSNQYQAVIQAGSSFEYGGEVLLSPISPLFFFGKVVRINRPQLKQEYLEAGIGLYHRVDDNISVEFLTAFGRGHSDGEGRRITDFNLFDPIIEVSSYSFTANQERTLWQMNWGGTSNPDLWYAGISLRWARIRYSNFSTSPPSLVSEVTGSFFDPALLFRGVVSPYLSADFQVGTSHRFKQVNWDLFRDREIYFSIGLRIHMGRME